MAKTPVARLCSIAIVAGLVSFVGLTTLAALAYPGGTYCEPDADRYRFWGNFFCDLTAPLTRKGIDNSRTAALASAGFACFSLASAPFWWLLGAMVGPATRRAVRVLGLISAIGTNVIAWVPSIHWPALHTATVFSATIPGLIAAVLGVVGLLLWSPPDAAHALARTSIATGSPGRAALLDARRVSGVVGLVALLVGLADAIGYAHAVATAAACVPWLPALQKVAATLLLGFMCSVAVAVSKEQPSRA